MRLRGGVCAVLCAASLLAVGAPAQAQLGPTLRDECIANGGNARACRGLHYLIQPAGVLCREAGGGEVCTEIDGRTLSEEVDESSWLVRALADQRRLDDNEPLQEELWAHTHNAYNAEAYPYHFYGTDPNQLYSITDQLRMGSRAIEIDMHWAHEPDAALEGGKRLAVCHAAQVPAGPTNIHVGCSVDDPTLAEFLVEIKDWLKDKPGELVMVYLENQLEGNDEAERQLNAAIEETVGPLVVMPKVACGSLPMNKPRSSLRNAHRVIRNYGRVIITGECDQGPYSQFVHNRRDRWEQSGTSYDTDYPDYPCVNERESKNYKENWIRYWGDLTGLSNGTGGGGDISEKTARNMVRCGVNMIGFDNLRPDDPRLRQLVWSWADESEPNPSGSCAYQDSTGYFRSGGCEQHRVFACSTDSGWVVVSPAGGWEEGAARCAAAGASFDVPPTGWENELLKEAKGAGEVWLDYAKVGPAWVPNPS